MSTSTVFPMIPAASKSQGFFAIISLVFLAGIVLMSWLALSMQNVRFTVSNEGLRLQGDLYGRLIPLKSLKLDESVVTNLNTDTDHQPTLEPERHYVQIIIPDSCVRMVKRLKFDWLTVNCRCFF